MDLYSLEAEKGVLGALMADNDAWHSIHGKIVVSDFHGQNHRLIFDSIAACQSADKQLDAIVLDEWLSARYPEHDYGGLAYLATMQHDAAKRLIVGYAEIVREKAQRRKLIALLNESRRSIAENPLPVADQIGELQERVESINSRNVGESKSFAELIRGAVEYIDEMHERKHQGGLAGIPTGLPELDRRIAGIRSKKLIVIGARPSVGKTVLAQQIALHAASKGHSVGVMSLEMSEEELAIRAFAHEFRLNGSKLTFGDEAELGQLAARMGEKSIKNYRIQTDVDTYDLGGIVARISEWKRKHQVELVVVDHIGLIETQHSGNTNDRLGLISRTLKKIAKRLDIAIVAVSQLGRAAEREKRRPQLSDLRDSGNVEQDADICIFLHVDADQAQQSAPLMDIGLLKNRQGRKGWVRKGRSDQPVFKFDGATQTISELGQYDR